MRHLILAIAFLSGCSSVVPSGIARLAAVSPLEADPADIAVSLDLPDGIAITDGSAQLTLMAKRQDTDQTSDEVYVLAKGVGSDGSEIFSISSDDIARFRTQQSEIRDWETTHPDDTNGSMGVTLEGCLTGNGPDDAATVSINIRTSAAGRFFPLVKNAPVAEVLQTGAFEPLQPCK